MKKALAYIAPILPLSFFLIFRWVFDSIVLSILDEQEVPRNGYEEEDDGYLKIAIVEDKAYWTYNNVFYEADVIDGDIVREEARPVDAFNLPLKDVTKMMTILDNIDDWD